MPPICASTGVPVKASGRRSVTGRLERLVTMICADRESFGIYRTLTSPCVSASSTSGTLAADTVPEIPALRGSRAKVGWETNGMTPALTTRRTVRERRTFMDSNPLPEERRLSKMHGLRDQALGRRLEYALPSMPSAIRQKQSQRMP